MKAMEDRIAVASARLCAARLAEIRDGPHSIETDRAEAIASGAAFAMLATDVDPEHNLLGLGPGVSLYTIASAQPRPTRSILEVIQAQSRHIHDVSNQLESARSALAERKIIERAKGIVMDNRRLSEKDAYALIRESAMSQNKRIVEIAEAIVSMTEMLTK
jgi:AmiR/NasT family two-component response regulator